MKKTEKRNKFKCRQCEKITETTGTDTSVPECCNAPMEILDEPAPCLLSATAEHARPEEMLEPCDDGRKGKI